ncbi:MAG: hypothetical protein IPO65_11965 [Saprospiraceae bacterium]|nr:hypothetical protein [Saprospiraceae bacterium]
MRIQKLLLLIVILVGLNKTTWAQSRDTMKKIDIEAVTITSYRFPSQEVKFYPTSMVLYWQGKKIELISLQDAPVKQLKIGQTGFCQGAQRLHL